MEINIMKLIQKSLLFASLLSAGAGVTTVVPMVANAVTVQAATQCSSTSRIKVKVAKAQLYNSKGKKLSRCLTKGKTCKPEEKTSIKGHEYYKVGKDEYVRTSEVSLEK